MLSPALKIKTTMPAGKEVCEDCAHRLPHVPYGWLPLRLDDAEPRCGAVSRRQMSAEPVDGQILYARNLRFEKRAGTDIRPRPCCIDVKGSNEDCPFFREKGRGTGRGHRVRDVGLFGLFAAPAAG